MNTRPDIVLTRGAWADRSSLAFRLGFAEPQEGSCPL